MNQLATQSADTAEIVIDRVDQFFDGVFAPLEAWLPRLQAQLVDRLAQGGLTGAQLVALTEAEAHGVLATSDRPIYGAGYCATGAIVTEGNPLAWWQGADRSLLASSTFGPGQAAIDLHRLEWYRVPAETLERHVAGPFVDYLCSNEITVTVALPVMLDGEFAGVVCADVLIASLEKLLLPAVETLGEAALVNASGRIVVSADTSYETGDRYAGVGFEADLDGLGEEVRVVRSARYPFALLVPTS
ncbi:PDC sensor domain-containing protein [Leucobacter sp. W1153]|uniref:PDC sensor domain-containing protein n=1 Tax=unclassified Leucobacter TaxID=2621730 RepID=UPI003F2E3995